MNRIVSIVFGIFLSLHISLSDAANIGFKKDDLSVVISIDGEISDGDYLKFRSTTVEAFAESTATYEWFINNLKKNNPQKYSEQLKKTGNIGGAISVTVLLNSNGGSLSEAIKIGDAVREMAIKTGISDTDKAKCISACFFIWAAGIERNVPYKNIDQRLGIHRIYFDQNQYKDLSSSDAEKQYRRAQDSTVSYLLRMGVPQDIANKVFRIPSNDIHFLTESEIRILEGITPYFDELLIARCGSYSKQEEADYLDCLIIYPKLSQEPYNRMDSLPKSQISSKCSAISDGYKNYLENAYIGKMRCRNMNSDIERWKRMATYLSFSHLIPK